MRPIERGDLPIDENGTPKIFSRYQDARGDLIDRLGEYCSYFLNLLSPTNLVFQAPTYPLHRSIAHQATKSIFRRRRCVRNPVF